MLPPEELDLIRREPSLPGLGDVLDASRFLERVRGAFPEAEVRGITADYLRYKPGTSCLAGYRLELGAALAPLSVHAIVRAPGAEGKRVKAMGRDSRSGATSLQRTSWPELGLLLEVFPDDAELRGLARAVEPSSLRTLLERGLDLASDPAAVSIDTLHYKPERRWVGGVRIGGEPRAVVKVHRDAAFPGALERARQSGRCTGIRVAPLLAKSVRRRALVLGWEKGESLATALGSAGFDVGRCLEVGRDLSRLHASEMSAWPRLDRGDWFASLKRQALMLAQLSPRAAGRFDRLVAELTARLDAMPAEWVPVHGDFNARQVLVGAGDPVFLDFDEACVFQAGSDLGSFLAHLDLEVARGRMTRERAGCAGEAFLGGYGLHATGGRLATRHVFHAAHLVLTAAEPFRRRDPRWPDILEQLIGRAESLLALVRGATSDGGVTRTPAVGTDEASSAILRRALDVEFVEPRLHAILDVGGVRRGTALAGARLVRHKAGRRALVEYRWALESPWQETEALHLLGKIRFKGLDARTPRLMWALRDAGLDGRDGVGVPEPCGEIPELNLWLQRRIPGECLEPALLGPRAAVWSARAAVAAHALHASGVTVSRRHEIADELAMLQARLAQVAIMRPEWRDRLDRLYAAASARMARHTPGPAVLIHRDYYFDQVLADGERLWLLDLDLAALGDPCLDHGNFVGHITELSVRRFGHPSALEPLEIAYFDQVSALCGPDARERAADYQTLTLMRHIEISTRHEDRRGLTATLLACCEARLGLAGASNVALPGVSNVADSELVTAGG